MIRLLVFLFLIFATSSAFAQTKYPGLPHNPTVPASTPNLTYSAEVYYVINETRQLGLVAADPGSAARKRECDHHAGRHYKFYARHRG